MRNRQFQAAVAGSTISGLKKLNFQNKTAVKYVLLDPT